MEKTTGGRGGRRGSKLIFWVLVAQMAQFAPE